MAQRTVFMETFLLYAILAGAFTLAFPYPGL